MCQPTGRFETASFKALCWLIRFSSSAKRAANFSILLSNLSDFIIHKYLKCSLKNDALVHYSEHSVNICNFAA